MVFAESPNGRRTLDNGRRRTLCAGKRGPVVVEIVNGGRYFNPYRPARSGVRQLQRRSEARPVGEREIGRPRLVRRPRRRGGSSILSAGWTRRVAEQQSTATQDNHGSIGTPAEADRPRVGTTATSRPDPARARPSGSTSSPAPPVRRTLGRSPPGEPEGTAGVFSLVRMDVAVLVEHLQQWSNLVEVRSPADRGVPGLPLDEPHRFEEG